MKKVIAFICLSCFLLGNANIVLAIEEFIKKDPGLIKLPNKERIDEKKFNAKMVKDEEIYKKKIKGLSGNSLYMFYTEDESIIKATHKLSEEEQDIASTRESWVEGYYTFYKVADKLLRANNLDTQNWRFAIDEKKLEDINAYATAANLVVINSSLVDTFLDNESALAAVIGHELSHHILGHITKNALAWERIGVYNRMVEASKKEKNAVGSLFCLCYMPKIVVWYKRIRQNELEADTESLTLVARAGYDIDYANDVMSTFAQLPEAKTKNYRDTHPKLKERIANINKQISLLDVDSLRIEGMKNLYEKPVMKMKRSSDKKTIVLVPEKSRGSVNYSKDTPQQKIILKAYKTYLNDDMKHAQELFEEAYRLDKKNYIPCLYLSYVNEYQYNQNHSKESLKQAKVWAKRAYKKKNTEKNTIKQKMDIESIYSSLKSK